MGSSHDDVSAAAANSDGSEWEDMSTDEWFIQKKQAFESLAAARHFASERGLLAYEKDKRYRKAPSQAIQILDALARLSCAEEAEAHAIGMRFHNGSGTIEFVMAANGEVPLRAVKFLDDTLRNMAEVAKMHKALKLKGQNMSLPGGCPTIEQVDEESGKLEYRVLAYNYRSWTARLRKYERRFKSLVRDIEGFREPACLAKFIDHTRSLLNSIEKLDKKISQSPDKSILDALTEEVAHALCCGVMFLSAVLHDIKEWRQKDKKEGGHAIRKLAAAHLVDGADIDDVFSNIEKMSLVATDIEVIAAATRSPILHRNIFREKIIITAVPDEACELTTTPKDAVGWRTLLEEALESYNLLELDNYERGRDPRREYPDYVLKEDMAKSLCHDLAEHGNFPTRGLVHCEVKLIHHLRRQSQQDGAPAALQYLGVAKDSCPGCRSFIWAYGKQQGTNFQIRDVPTKTCFPHVFPDLLGMGMKQAALVLDWAFASLADDFFRAWEGAGLRRHVEEEPLQQPWRAADEYDMPWYRVESNSSEDEEEESESESE